MGKNYLKLQVDHDMYKRWYENEKNQKEKLQRKLNATRGIITRMKNKMRSKSKEVMS